MEQNILWLFSLLLCRRWGITGICYWRNSSISPGTRCTIYLSLSQTLTLSIDLYLSRIFPCGKDYYYYWNVVVLVVEASSSSESHSKCSSSQWLHVNHFLGEIPMSCMTSCVLKCVWLILQIRESIFSVPQRFGR